MRFLRPNLSIRKPIHPPSCSVNHFLQLGFSAYFSASFAGLTDAHSPNNPLGLSIDHVDHLVEIDKLEQNEEAKAATKIVNAVSVNG